MANVIVLPKEQFDRVIDVVSGAKNIDHNTLYKIYQTTSEAIQGLLDSNVISNAKTVNPLEVAYYCLGEYLYTNQNIDEEERNRRAADINYIHSVAAIASDKYLTLSMFNHVERKLANKYIPPVSSINLYLNFMLNILQKYEKNDPKATLITDLLIKSVSISRCILGLLIDGYETEAMSSWRTLHECECTLLLLEKYGDPLINRYLIHMQYGIVFKKEDLTDEHGNKIFADMKEEMHELGLKSKDIKKYIEYGWLYEIEGTKEDPLFKLNFRDGLQRIAGLSNYASRYEMSSEIIHSTPMLIYSNKEYFYFVTLLSLYESFFRLEKVFVNLFSKQVSEEQMKSYLDMRKVYYAQLTNIYKRELTNFQKWQGNKKSK